ncbi:MAG: thioesterase family protein [Caulobacterales bacterium]
MQVLHSSDIKSREIDHLGHMNVRFYMERAQRANKALMTALGLGANVRAKQGVRLVQKDSYTRYHREQFQGSVLAVKGGVLKADAERLSLYFELVNDAKAEVAATFIISAELVDLATRTTLPLPAAALAAALQAQVELPDYGRPRTIDLDPPTLDLAFEDVAGRLGEDHTDPMSRRIERVIEADECDAYGFLADDEAMSFGGWRMPRPSEMKNFGPMTFVSETGHRLGWASMETRTVKVSQPRAGETLCSLGAEIGLHSKVRHSRRWIFNTTTGRIISLNDNVSVALDLDARRSIEIPPNVRAQLEKRHLPEFA